MSKIDFEKLKEDFKESAYKNIEIADLRAFIQHKLEQMLKQNATPHRFRQRLQAIIDAYNAGSSSADNYFDELDEIHEGSERRSPSVTFARDLTEDELELFDLLKKDKMTKEETQKVRLAAKSLLHRLREESPKVLVQDWFKDAQSKVARQVGGRERLEHASSRKLRPGRLHRKMQQRFRSDAQLREPGAEMGGMKDDVARDRSDLIEKVLNADQSNESEM